MVTPAKQQMPHVPAGGDEANFHALILKAPKPKSVAVLRKFVEEFKSGSAGAMLEADDAMALAEAIEDLLR